ncbi:beta-xylosidase [Segetibacter sp. 3557_3]|nr:beta-xylosidase [Segetibacter sp. 3557_3]
MHYTAEPFGTGFIYFAKCSQSCPYLIILLSVFLNSCSSRFIPVRPQPGDPSAKNIYLADPTIFRHKGTYYLYGTGGDRYNQGFAVYSSKDLKTWVGPSGKLDGYALRKGQVFGSAQFWAPQVFGHAGKFYMAYAANEHIGMAVSTTPLGPFEGTSAKPISGETKQIDPYVFNDGDGRNYLYYVVVANGGNRIYVAEMQADMLSVKSETARLCIEAGEQWENVRKDQWSVTEGPTVLKHGGLYYLVYSANDFRSVDYAVGYATSPSPLGPWTKSKNNPIIHRSVTGENGSGHGDVVKAKNGQLWYVFHTHQSSGKVAPRKTAIMKIGFVKDKSTGIDRLVAEPGSFRFLYEAN